MDARQERTKQSNPRRQGQPDHQARPLAPAHADADGQDAGGTHGQPRRPGQWQRAQQRPNQQHRQGSPGQDRRWRCDGPVLVTLVGDEPLAPLVLARQLNVCRVICIAPPVVDWRSEPLIGLLHRDGRAADWHSLTVLDVPSGQRSLERLLALSADTDVVFDLTNARGVLGLALYEVAHQRELDAPDRSRLVRVDWSDRMIRSISPDQMVLEPLRANIDVNDYLHAHGKHVLGVERAPGSPSPFGAAAHRLARNIPRARPLLDATHRSAPEQPLRIHHLRALGPLIDELIEDGVLAWRDSALFTTSMQAFQFLHGRWLEEYLFEIADASGQFDDCASGVRFRWSFSGEEGAGKGKGGRGEVANEIDFAGTAHGRATLASCKTGGHDVNGPLYELLTLAERAAGRSVVAVFATTDTLDQSARRRAAALGIRTLDATRLVDPETVLATLIHGTPTPTPASAATRQ